MPQWQIQQDNGYQSSCTIIEKKLLHPGKLFLKLLKTLILMNFIKLLFLT